MNHFDVVVIIADRDDVSVGNAVSARERLDRFPDSILASAINKKSFRPLLEMMERALFEDTEEDGEAEETAGT